MPVTCRTAFECFFLPDDAVAALAQLVAFIDSATPGERYRQILYGFTLAPAADAVLRAHARGVDCRLILDLTQSRGPTEAALLHGMLTRGFPADAVRIGTSTEHQIIHDKVALITGADVPDGDFDTWEEARASRYPTTVEGSFNWSASALKQMNTVIFSPGKSFAAGVEAQFNAQWGWLTAHEPAYQLTGATP